MNLRPAQSRFLEWNPDKAILNWEMRVGKSLPGALWADDPKRNGNAYIVTIKSNKKDWQKYGTKATVLTKEEFKKTPIVNPTALVIDEAHNFGSPLFLRGRSQLATKLYTIVKQYPGCHVLLLTATPVKNDAWSLHTLLTYVGVYYPWKWWREEFFYQQQMPYLPRPSWMPHDQMPTAWVPKSDWRERIQHYLDEHVDTEVLGKEDKEDRIIKVHKAPYKKPKDQLVNWMHEHRYEQEGKEKEILKVRGKKIIVVAHFTEQIDQFIETLSPHKPVFVLDGRTKDPDVTKREAQEAPTCYFIVQSGCGLGWDGWMFDTMVFASMSHSCVHHTQMRGRLRSTKHLKPVDYYYLLGGRWDTKIYDTVIEGHNFVPPRTS